MAIFQVGAIFRVFQSANIQEYSDLGAGLSGRLLLVCKYSYERVQPGLLWQELVQTKQLSNGGLARGSEFLHQHIFGANITNFNFGGGSGGKLRLVTQIKGVQGGLSFLFIRPSDFPRTSLHICAQCSVHTHIQCGTGRIPLECQLKRIPLVAFANSASSSSFYKFASIGGFHPLCHI